MEDEIKQIIASNAKTRKLLTDLLSDCPDVAEGKLLEKALRDINTAMEFIVSAKNLKSDSLEARERKGNIY